MNSLLELPSAMAVNAPTQGQANSPFPILITDPVKTGIEINWWAGKAETVDIRHARVGVARKPKLTMTVAARTVGGQARRSETTPANKE
jgi:hypothetical protein